MAKNVFTGSQKKRAGSALDGLSEEVNAVKENQEKLQKQANEIDKKIEELNRDKISFITVSGIFVAIFTFISLEIQVLAIICDIYKLAGFTLIFGSILISLILLLDYLARSWISGKIGDGRASMAMAAAFVLLVAGFILFDIGSEDWKCKDVKLVFSYYVL